MIARGLHRTRPLLARRSVLNDYRTAHVLGLLVAVVLGCGEKEPTAVAPDQASPTLSSSAEDNPATLMDEILGDTSAPGASAVTYYVDATDGSDLNNGLSPETAWKTIAKVNTSVFLPGDRVLFQRGEVWREQLNIASSGTPTAPITFGAYGSGLRPLIDADGLRENCIKGNLQHYIRITAIQCTEWLSSGVVDFGGNGWIVQFSYFFNGGNNSAPDHAIRVFAPNGSPLLTGIRIQNNTIRRVNTIRTELVGITGIQLQGVDGAVISGNNISTVNTIGIRVVENTGSINNQNVVIENNDLHGCYGNVVVSFTDNLIIRNNLIHDGVSIGIGLAFDTDNADIHDNQIYNLTTRTATLWNGADINHDSQNGRFHHNRVSAVYNNAFVVANGSGWSIDHNTFDITQNTDKPLAIKVFEGSTWTSDFNTFWNGSPVASGTRTTNGSFESFAATANDGQTDSFTGWTLAPGAGGGLEAVTASDPEVESIPTGIAALKMVPASSGVQTIRQKFNLKAKRVYQLSFWARSAGGVGRLAINRNTPLFYLQDSGNWRQTANYDVVQVAASETNWTKKILKFTTHNATAHEIRFENFQNRGTLYLDNFVVKELGPAIAEYNAVTGDLTGGVALDLNDWRLRTGQDQNSTFAPP